MAYQVRDANLTFTTQYLREWRVPLDTGKVDFIVLHHPAANWTVWQTHEYHRDVCGWGGIGYNFYIHKDGTIYKGRGYDQGAGVYNHNNHTVHISFQGNFETVNTYMSDAQFNAGVWMIAELKKVFPRARVVGHKYFGGTVCPGQHFPLQEMQSGEYRKDDDEMTEEERKLLQSLAPVVTPEWAKATVHKLELLGARFEGTQPEAVWRSLVITDRAGIYDDALRARGIKNV